ncbi:unnamed protein product [Boreogadus saida]
MVIPQSMSKMGLVGAIGVSLVFLSLTQIPFTHAEGPCILTSVSSRSPSTLHVEWERYLGATNYFLDVRVIDSTDIAPVVLTFSGSAKETDVHGLRPGAHYSVTLKVFKYYFVVCTATLQASTVPATSQIISRRALSSTSVRLEWARVPTTDRYVVLMEVQVGRNHSMTLRNTSVVFTGLEPRTVYNCSVFTENEAGRGLRSALKPILTLAPPPNDIVSRQTGRQRARVSWRPVDRVLLYRVAIRNQDQPNSQPMVANATAPYLDFDTLTCTTYDISVSSFHRFLLPGEPNDVSFTSDAPSAAGGAVVDYRCSSNTAVVSWVPVVGADSYRATATHNGTVMSCLSQGSQCQIQGMACGQSYVVSVITVAGDCESHGNSTTSFQTASCPPDNLRLYRECSLNLISLSWDRVHHTDRYIATLVDSMGETQHCMTADTNCIFTRTTCGRSYNFTVTSVTGDCSSQSSPPSFIRTAPCNPATFTSSSSCHSDQVLVTWEPAAGAFYYEVTALGNQGPNDLHSCSSTGTNCTMHGIQCGQHLTTSLTAFDDECASRTLVNTVSESGPCVPQNVSATMDCGTDSVTLSWEEAPGALFYTGLAVDAAGRRSVCHTLGTSCQVQGLRCSAAYTASVVSSNSRCNSSESAAVTVETASCPPDSVVATLDCGANQALVSWASRPGTGSYTATLVDPEDRLLSCSTTQHRCTVTGLRCGQRYTVAVNQHDGVCPSMPSSPVHMASVACGPTDVNASVSCASGTLEVGWSATPGADRYTAALTRGSDGQTLYCNASAPPCGLETSDCGQEYSVEVTSYNGTCRSFPSNTSVVREAPCVPTDLVVERICGNSSADVSWRASRGALRYDVMMVAAAGGGERLGCSSSGSTACRLQGLTCGRNYNVSVVAVGDGCSSRSEAVALRAAPCRPSQLTVRMDCLTNDARLTWDASASATSYSAQATGPGGQELSCGPEPRPTCLLTGLRCGQRYVFTATAADGHCPGADSLPLEQITAPCVPTGVLPAVDCSSNALNVSWTPFSIPVNYSVTAVDRTGGSASLSCSSVGGGGGGGGGSGCVVAGLLCGQQYSVTVRAQGDPCLGPSSAAQSVRSVPCAPASLRRVMNCPSNTVQASWDSAPGALSYVSTVTDAHNDTASCSTSFHGCSFPGLTCARTYSFSVVALGNRCNSSVSHGAAVATAPCDPENVQASLDCSSGVATVTWTAGPGSVPYYTVVASASGQPELSVQTNVTSCALDQLRCGAEYTVVVLAGDGSCNSSVYASTSVTTAPCAPRILSHEMLLNCSSTQALVAWAPDAHATSFNVSATTAGAAAASCSSSSSSSNSSSCVLDGLSCGRRYAGEAVALGDRCPSTPSTPFEILTAPCTPTNVVPSYTCGSSMALLRWDEARGRESFRATARAGEHADSCTSAETHCSLLSLLCGRLYEVSVDAVAAHCNSSHSGDALIQTAPCAPQNVSASLECSGNSGRVSWLASAGATRYDVQALGRDGDSLNCTTNTTTCSLPSMHCAVTYTLTVTPYSDTCRGFASTPIEYIAVPCRQSGLNASLQCSTNTAVVSWTPAVGILTYNSSAEAIDVTDVRSCATSGPGCNISSLLCGERYRVVVSGQGRTCPSPAVDWRQITTAPCQPTLLSVESSCDSDAIEVSWRPSQGSDGYRAVAEAPDGARLSCATTGGAAECRIAGLRCGQRYSVHVVGVNAGCPGEPSNATTLQTETKKTKTKHKIRRRTRASAAVVTELDCRAGSLNVTWQPSDGARGYVATVTGVRTGHHPASCNTTETHCLAAALDCGADYNVSVLAYDLACSSAGSPVQLVATAPCPPLLFDAAVDCGTNAVSVSWNGSAAGTLYTATALGSDGQRHDCTGRAGCSVSSLGCATEYNVSITPARGACTGSQSPTQLVRTAPCVPRLRAVEMDCLSESAWVMWEAPVRDLGQNYTVTSTDQRGHVETFECSDMLGLVWCAVSNMTCGRHLNFTLAASDQQCASGASNMITTETAPCPPLHVRAAVGCENRTASVSWRPSPGALTYTATLEHADGQTACCTTAGAGCDIAELPCGNMFVLLVTAEGRTCNSSQSPGSIIRTEPCVPLNLRVDLSCGSNVASVRWDLSQGGQQFRVEARSGQGDLADECQNFDDNCDLTRLACGQLYAVTVAAENSDCTSAHSDSVEIRTAPCTPANASAAVDCVDNALTVSWSQSSGADSYRATVVDATGQNSSCVAMAAGNCSLSGLSCGEMYRVSVVSSDGVCDSPPTDVMETHAVPCAPGRVEALMDCASQTALLSWGRAGGAVGYTVTASPVFSGAAVTRDTNATTAAMEGLQCGQAYFVIVKTRGGTCDSGLAHMSGLLLTQPCVPSHIYTDYTSGIGQVSWDPAAGADRYTARAVTSEGAAVSCDTIDTNCGMRGLNCSQLYNVSVHAHNGACNDSVVSLEPEVIQTEPCAPNGVLARVECAADAAVVSWESSRGALSYVVHMDGRSGHSLSCHAVTTSCTLDGVRCGAVYYVSVAALGDRLNSTGFNTVVMASGPCAATQPEVEVDCLNATAAVSWVPAPGAVSYAATATAADGRQRAECASQGAACLLTGLRCGLVYSLALGAVNEQCRNDSREDVAFSTRPCPPQRLGVDLLRGASSARLHWERRPGVDNYTATANCSDHAEVTECVSTNGTCDFSALHCGESYRFSVVARSGLCQSEVSGTVEILTELCQVSLSVNGSCDSETVAMNWTEAAGALTYLITAEGDLGWVRHFQTNDTTLEAELLCGQSYTLTARAQGQSGDGPVSAPAHFIAGPCAPRDVETFVQCEDHVGSVSWALSDGADAYTAVATADDGHTHMCNSPNSTCTFDDLHCGELYLVHVVAHGHLCSSAPSNSTSIRMGSLDSGWEAGPGSLDSGWEAGPGSLDGREAGPGSLDGREAGPGSLDGREAGPGSLDGREAGPGSLDSGGRRGQALWTGGRRGQALWTRAGRRGQALWTRAGGGARLSGLGREAGPGSLDSGWEAGPGSLDGREAGPGSLDSGGRRGQALWTRAGRRGQALWTRAGRRGQALWTGGRRGQALWTRAGGGARLSGRAGGGARLSGRAGGGARLSGLGREAGPGSLTRAGGGARLSGLGREAGPGSLDSGWEAGPGSLDGREAGPGSLDGREAGPGSLDGREAGPGSLDGREAGPGSLDGREAGPGSLDGLGGGARLSGLGLGDSSAPCIPQGLAATLDCSLRVATLTWDPSEGAVVYNATAETSGGHVLSAGTAGTVAQFSDLQCGQTYFLSVQAVESVCRSVPSPAITLDSAPCPPTNVSSSMDCLSNIAVVTWSASAGAEYYTAAVTDWQGGATCMSSSEQCGMANLGCGQNYTVTVTASRQNCPSEPSAPSTLQSVPCLPSGVDIVMNCSAQEAAVSWSPSQGALSYAVSAMSAPAGEMSTCASAGPGCTLTNLTCGQSYRVQVLALDNICSSLPSRVAVFSTEPCQPLITSTVLDCYTDTALVEWTHSEGALSYTTTARSDGDHHAVHCTTNYTNCELGPLECSQTYTLSTVASGDTCDSDVSGSVQLPSVPCPPSAVVTEEVCSAHMAHVTWDPVAGAASYLVQAFGVQEHYVQCASVSGGACTLRDLLCGFTYNVTVLAVNGVCNVSESAVSVLPAEPCAPNLVQAALDCESGAVDVSWEASQGALSYTAVAQGNGGYSETRNTTGTTCQFGALPCGLSYSVFVRAVGEDCSSADSAAAQIDSVPCEPQQVAAVMECSNDTGVVSWEPAEGGLTYRVRAFGADGHEVACSSAGDGCELPSMHCGQLYNLTVTALDGECDNVRANLNLQSVPCRPTNVRTSMPQCPFTRASVSWEHAGGARAYAAQAGGGVSCNATAPATSCPLGDLLCGRTYNVSVAAADGVCSSPESEVAQLNTAPCPPQDVSLSMECEAGVLTVSWAPDPDADAFVATVVSDTSARHTCAAAAAAGTSACSVGGLPCGRRYTVSVVAARAGCESEPSAPREISSAPCVPRNPEGRLDCVTNSAWVSWDNAGGGALRYTALTEALTGDHNSSCSALPSAGSCSIPHLECGTEYVFRVVGANDVCVGGYSDNFTLETAPCSLENITAVHECGSNRILVSWENTPGSPQYVVTAEGPDQQPITCNSTFSSCELQGAACGTQYTVMVSASSDKCGSLRSPPMDVTTAPCVPRSVEVGRSCEEDGAAVSWSPSPAVTSFLLTATGASGDVRTCEGPDANCTLARLPCGEAYAVNVTASDGNCTSEPSVDVFFQTMPCRPTQLSVDYQCEANAPAAVSWTASEGSLQYHLYASPELGGAPLVCSTPHTSCRVALECGGVYNLSVVASDGLCNGSFSAPLRFGAVPCPPDSVRVRVRLIDGLQVAMATWPAVACAVPVEYLVSLEGRIQDDPRAGVDLWSYPTERLYYEFPLPCGAAFNLTVRSVNRAGLSEPGPQFQGVTAPCPPANVQYSTELFDRITVSWDASVFATGYTVYSSSGAVCNTSALICQNLEADPDSVWVTASNAVGESEPSANITGPVFGRRRRDLRSNEVADGSRSALSTPGSVRLEARPAASLYVAWTAVQGATLYTVIVKQPSASRPALVTTVDTEFTVVGGLEPRTRYCVSLAAKNALGQSPYSTPQCLATGAPE